MTPEISLPDEAWPNQQQEISSQESSYNPQNSYSISVGQAATKLLNLGFSVIPVNADKTPACKWKQFQVSRMNPENIPHFFNNENRLGIVAGEISGNVELIDIDDPDLFQPYLDALESHSPGLPDKLCQRKTPNGYHLIYRCQKPVAGNQKLAMSADNKVRIETRGQGGYFLHSPSKGYEVIKNSLIDCPVLSIEEVQAIHLVAGLFDERITPKHKQYIDDVRPGDVFNEEHNTTALLEEFGWAIDKPTTAGMGYTRPGKKSGTSGVLLNTGKFYCWSTNAHPLEAGQSYSAFALYAMYKHSGDYSAAVKDLAVKGYGKKSVGSNFPTPQVSSKTGFANIAKGFVQPESWELPISIDTPILPPVTREMLPKILGDMVFAISANTETPPELATILGLAVYATASQKKYIIESSPGHTEQLSLWGITALESGNRKSSVEKKMVGPLRKWEAKTREKLEPIIRDATAQLENEMAVIKGLRNSLSKCPSDKRDDIAREILTLESQLTEVPTVPQLWEQDITPEHLGTVMNANHECLGLFSSEGGIFDIMSGRYSKGVPNLDLFLQSHSGDPVKVSRGSRSPVNLSEPALSIGISPQPAVIKGMAERPGFRERGLSARFMYVLPISPLGGRELTNLPQISDEVYVQYSDAIKYLLDEDYPDDGPKVLNMSPEAYKMWMDFSISVEVDLRDGGRFEHLKDWAGKLPGLVARIAGVYHCVEPDGETVSGKTMEMALMLTTVLIPHTLAAFDLMGADEGMSGARKILNWICRNTLSEFSGRDCFEATKGTFKKVSVMDISLVVLKEHFIIRELPPEKKPGRPSIMFEVNPGIKFQEPKPLRNIRKTPNDDNSNTPKTHSQYSQNSKNTNEDSFCEYCEPFSDNKKSKSQEIERSGSDELCLVEGDEWEEI